MENISKSQVGKAGKKLRKGSLTEDDRLECLHILAYWRTKHSEPLKSAFSDLKTVCEQIDNKAILALREKRAISIINKLRREPSMNLTTMQDIAGCRAIVTSQKDVNKIVRTLRKKRHIELANNYIKTPKVDGYRGVHLVGRYDIESFSNLCIEFQVRTHIQHAWATAGEITELFSARAIKNLYGDDKWKRFYKLVSDCMAIVDEKYVTRDITPGNIDFTHATHLLREKHGAEIKTISKEIRKQSKDLKVHEKFQVFRSSLKFTSDLNFGENRFCVVHAANLNTEDPTVEVHMCKTALQAREINFNIEKSIATDVNELVVLLSVDAMADLEKAYPNYFADSGYFLSWLRAIEKV